MSSIHAQKNILKSLWFIYFFVILECLLKTLEASRNKRLNDEEDWQSERMRRTRNPVYSLWVSGV